MAATFKGISFPFKAGTATFPEQSTDNDLIKQSIIRIIMTSKKERIMRPTFGSGVMARVFDNNDALTASLLQAEVYSAIGRFEPRALVRGVDIEQSDSTMLITIRYIVVATQQQDSVSLSVPTPM